jgi:putative restriction endonuclease
VVKAILTTKVSPTYDDLPEERYHFPRMYLRQVEQAVGDFAIYYEPRRPSGDLNSRGGRQAYFAVATITSVEPDHVLADHFYARVTGYLEFDRAVPFRRGEHYYEAFLRREDGKTSKGAFGRAVRELPDDEFDAILRTGFAQGTSESFAPEPRNLDLDEPPAEYERPIIESVIARPFRDQAFTRQIRRAYDNRCTRQSSPLSY